MATLKEIAPCRKELRVQVPAADVETEFELVYREIKKTARVPGFRVGFAPQDLLERHYGNSAREEVMRRLVHRSINEALKSHSDLDLVGRPQVTDVQLKPKEPLRFSAQIEVAPQVPLGRYKGLQLQKPKAGISEEEVGKVISHLQESHAELAPVLEPRPALDGDFLLVDLTEKVPGKEPLKRRDVVIHLNLQKDTQGTMKDLLGMNPGSDRTVTLPDGKSVLVSLKQIKVKELPPLDDSFARRVGAFENLGQLKEAIREDMRKHSEESEKQFINGQAATQLLENWKFDVPPSLVASSARRILKERELQLLGQGVPQEKVEEQARILTEQAKLDALKEVKLFFILRRIASQEKLTAAEEEMQERVAQLAQRMGATSDQVLADLKKKELLEELAWGIIRGKVFDLIVKEADVKEIDKEAA